MKREDLRDKIIKSNVESEYITSQEEYKKSNTDDFLYLDSPKDYFNGKLIPIQRRISATDYAKMNNVCVYENYYTVTGKKTTGVWLRCGDEKFLREFIGGDGNESVTNIDAREYGICPSLHYSLPSNILQQNQSSNENKSEEQKLDIVKIKDKRGVTLYHALQIGEYPKTKVDENLGQILETLYNGGKIKEGITCTGRWYSTNGQKEDGKNYAGKHSPEFEYQGNRYVRVVTYPYVQNLKYSDGTKGGEVGTVKWVKVEPISFIIKNWDEMPKSINPGGSGTAQYFDLRAEEAIVSNIPFYPKYEARGTKWKNSTIRGFLNGIDVANIQQGDINAYNLGHGGDFTGECNFLNEAFNLSREPMIEYEIPCGETEIADDAFSGCISLKKLIMHSGIKSVGRRAFDGLNFKYVYTTETGEIVFSQELPKDKEEYKNLIEIDKMLKAFKDFDYGLLLESSTMYNIENEGMEILENDEKFSFCEEIEVGKLGCSSKLNDLVKMSEVLNKNKFSVPSIFADALIQNGGVENFCENSDFRFFKSELPGIMDELLKFPEEERLDFFKFANNLGCFSTQKMLDKNAKETDVILAQKSCSLLAQLLKTHEMKLRKIS